MVGGSQGFFSIPWSGFPTPDPAHSQKFFKYKKFKNLKKCKQSGRDRGKTATGDGPEVGGMQPQAEECWEPQEDTRGGKDSHLEQGSPISGT